MKWQGMLILTGTAVLAAGACIWGAQVAAAQEQITVSITAQEGDPSAADGLHIRQVTEYRDGARQRWTMDWPAAQPADSTTAYQYAPKQDAPSVVTEPQVFCTNDLFANEQEILQAVRQYADKNDYINRTFRLSELTDSYSAEIYITNCAYGNGLDEETDPESMLRRWYRFPADDSTMELEGFIVENSAGDIGFQGSTGWNNSAWIESCSVGAADGIVLALFGEQSDGQPLDYSLLPDGTNYLLKVPCEKKDVYQFEGGKLIKLMPLEQTAVSMDMKTAADGSILLLQQAADGRMTLTVLDETGETVRQQIELRAGGEEQGNWAELLLLPNGVLVFGAEEPILLTQQADGSYCEKIRLTDSGDLDAQSSYAFDGERLAGLHTEYGRADAVLYVYTADGLQLRCTYLSDLCANSLPQSGEDVYDPRMGGFQAMLTTRAEVSFDG